MAARKLKIHIQEDVKTRIQASQLINRLQGHALGKVNMADTQVRAALGLLRKVLPDVASTEITVKTTTYIDDLLAIQGQASRVEATPSLTPLLIEG